MTTALYRHFAADGTLLYVGISLSWPERTRAHRSDSRWFDQVARLEIEHFPTRDEALAAEREAIQCERPKFNIVHNRERPQIVTRGARKSTRTPAADPVLGLIKGPDAIVGPALIYRDNLISVMIAHGERGGEGEIAEIVLGKFSPEAPADWSHMCASVVTLRHADEITITEAKRTRAEIVGKLKRHLRSVEAFDTDLALALANATRFPSEKARQILDQVASEKGVAA